MVGEGARNGESGPGSAATRRQATAADFSRSLVTGRCLVGVWRCVRLLAPATVRDKHASTREAMQSNTLRIDASILMPLMGLRGLLAVAVFLLVERSSGLLLGAGFIGFQEGSGCTRFGLGVHTSGGLRPGDRTV